MSDKRMLVISDIHGCYDEFESLLKHAEYQPFNDQLILLGDYMDRGKQSKQVLEKVIQLVKNGAAALRGNHDQMFLDFMQSDQLLQSEHYMMNGGLDTLETYVGKQHFSAGVTMENLETAKDYIRTHYPEHVEFISKLPYYYETEHHLFIHAGINPSLDNWKDTSEHEMIWIRQPFLDKNHSYDFTVVHGHTPSKFIRGNDDNTIYFGNKKIGIDGACAYGGMLNCLVIKGKSYERVYVMKGTK